MRRIVAGTFVSLDGVMQAPGGPDEDRDGGFEHGGWVMPLFPEDLGNAVQGWMNDADALLLGRRTYDIFSSWWPNTPADDEMGARLNSMPKYVASRTLRTVEWSNARLLEGDASEAVAQLRNDGDGEIHIAGSGNLIQTLLKHNLIDEFRVVVFPVILGTGKRLFGNGAIPAALRLRESTPAGNGVVVMKYETAGVPEYGTPEQLEASG